VLGAVEYLTKPIDGEKLIETLESIGGSGKDVLVVDDDDVSRNLLRRLLVREGWRVHEAQNGLRGLEQLNRLQPSVVLLDLMMPEMDGFEMLKEMRRRPEVAATPVVVLTAHQQNAMRDYAKELGVDRYLTKPITIGDFIKELNSLLED